MILGYRLSDYREYKLKNPVSISLAKKISNILVVGKSGSGKSSGILWYLWNMLYTGESIVYISDYKGGEEYEPFEGSDSYQSGTNAIKLIENFYDFFTEIRSHKIRLQHHVTLCVEEWSGILSYAETQNKKLKAELMSKIGEILSVGRGLNIGVILILQRADATYFSSGTREQFQCILSFGRCSTEQFRMLGFSNELEENPTVNYKSGQALALIDAQDSIQEIIVPWIKNQNIMCQGIRSHLDKQPSISSLTQAIAEGKGLGL